jgi:hypothetical protein
MKLSAKTQALKTHCGGVLPPRPRARTEREYRALYGGLDQYGPDEVRDRLRDQLGCRPTKAALGALAQATLDLIAEELRTQLTESLEEQRWAAKIPYSYIDALQTIVSRASSEPDFEYEVSYKKRLLERERFAGVEGGYWTTRRGDLHRVRKFGPLSPGAFVRALAKTLACYPHGIGGVSITHGIERPKTADEIAMVLMSLTANSAAVN